MKPVTNHRDLQIEQSVCLVEAASWCQGEERCVERKARAQPDPEGRRVVSERTPRVWREEIAF